MTPMPWFRVYSEILDDRKIKRICKKTGHSKALIIGVWICLLALANDAPERGMLNISDDMPYTLEDIEDETGLPHEILTQLLDEFRSLGMMNGKTTLVITNWNKRQFKSDNSTARVQRYRRKERFNETFQERSNNVIDTESETEQNRIEVDSYPATAIPLSAEGIFNRVTGFATFPGNQRQYINTIEAMRETWGADNIIEVLRRHYKTWCNTPRKDGNGNYNPLNLGWVDQAQKELAKPPVSFEGINFTELTPEQRDEYIKQKYGELEE